MYEVLKRRKSLGLASALLVAVAISGAPKLAEGAEPNADPSGYRRVDLESAKVSLAIPEAFATAPSFEKYGNRREAEQAAALFNDDPPVRYYLDLPLWTAVDVDGKIPYDRSISVQVLHRGRVKASSTASAVRARVARSLQSAYVRRVEVAGRPAFYLTGQNHALLQQTQLTEYLCFLDPAHPRMATAIMFQRTPNDTGMDAIINQVMGSVRLLEVA